MEAKLGPDHPDTLKTLNNIAIAYMYAGRLPEAIALFEGTLKVFETKLGPDHPTALSTRNTLAIAYETVGRLVEAIALFEGAYKVSEAKFGPDNPDTLASRGNLAVALQEACRTSESIAILEPTLKLMEAKVGLDHPWALELRNGLATAYESLDRWDEAEVLRRDVLARRRRTNPPDSPLLAEDLALLGRNLLAQSRCSKAEPLLREGLVILEKARPDDWGRYDAMSLLAGALLGQSRYAEAESWIVAGYEGMKTHEARIPVPKQFRLREAAERVVRLYEAWGKPDEAATWKAKLGMPDLPADVFAAP